MVDYQSAFEKPFTDIKKLLIGILFSIVPIINFFARGFILECSGLGKTKPSKKMPEWKDFGSLFVKGLLYFIITIIYLVLMSQRPRREHHTPQIQRRMMERKKNRGSKGRRKRK